MEEKKKTEEKEKKKPEEKKKKPLVEDNSEMLIRIMGQDIPGSRNVHVGLTYIKGVSWAISNAACLQLGIDKRIKIGELKKENIPEIEKTLLNLQIPDYMKNRRLDFDTGKTEHIYTVNLDMRREFDIKRMKQIKSYKGNRHALKLPVRGQRTRSHFRKVGVAVGVKKAKTGKKS